MSTTPQYVRAARTQPCPHCHTEIGETCRTPRGKSTYTHGDRMRLTEDAYRIGVEEGLSCALSYIDWQVGKSGVNTTVSQVRKVIENDLTSLAKWNNRREQERN